MAVNLIRALFQIFLLFVFASYPAVQAFANTNNGINQLQKFIKNIKTAQGEFVQTQINEPVAGKSLPDVHSRGHFTFSRPSQFIWAYTQPYEQLLQTDGKTFFIYDKDLNQLNQKPLNTALNDSPAAILFGQENLQDQYELKPSTFNQLNEEMKVLGVTSFVTLKPKANDTQFQSIQIGFKNDDLVMMKLFDMFNNITLLYFVNVKKNIEIKPQAFQFIAPPGIEINHE